MTALITQLLTWDANSALLDDVVVAWDDRQFSVIELPVMVIDTAADYHFTEGVIARSIDQGDATLTVALRFMILDSFIGGVTDPVGTGAACVDDFVRMYRQDRNANGILNSDMRIIQVDIGEQRLGDSFYFGASFVALCEIAYP